MEIYRDIVSPILDKLPSEPMHDSARELLHLAEINSLTLRLLERFAYRGQRFTNEKLKVTLGGIVELDNPLMLSAGWDKYGKTVAAWHTLGMGSVVVGTVPEKPQPGNEQPRQFYKDGVGLNRMGFNTPGMEAVWKNLQRYRNLGIPIGISVGQNKNITPDESPQAHAKVIRKMYDMAAFFEINVSSPNTKNLRDLQAKGFLVEIVKAAKNVMQEKGEYKPLFIKIAPELSTSQLDGVIDVVVGYGLAGIIASNTTTNPEIKAKYGWGNEAGGLSGYDANYRQIVLSQIAHIHRETKGNNIQTIGIGGIWDANTAIETILTGADAIGSFTAVRKVGPSLPGRINEGIYEYMVKNGINNLKEIVGIDAHKY